MPIALIVVLVIALIGGAVAFFATRPTEPAAPVTPITVTETPIENPIGTTVPSPDTTPTSETPLDTPAPGATYSETASYLTPRRTEQSIAINLTVENGIITASEVIYDGKPVGQTSNDYQANFEKAYKAVVIGQPIADLNLSRIGGASLTTGAFNEAVAKIAAEAAV